MLILDSQLSAGEQSWSLSGVQLRTVAAKGICPSNLVAILQITDMKFGNMGALCYKQDKTSHIGLFF